ncbi:ELM1/GtrOC1 family putative glycosyltransferase [Methylophilaceae bacterium]|nr:ELM1/GtrOC1 family putative glycosyltransferase [Methylophilaceae bacterium]
MEKIKIIWRLLDGKKGHEKQSLALVESLKIQSKCKIFDIKIQNLENPIIGVILKRYNLDKGFMKPDIAIGAGHKTHFHLLAIKRCFGAKIVVIMKPSLPLMLFDLCVIPKHDDLKSSSNIFITNTLLINFNLNTKKKENMALFLIGGPSKHYHWDSKRVLEQIKNISKQFKFKKLLIATSRRTPIDFINEFKKLKIKNIKLYEHTKIMNGWFDKNINKVKNIWVTNDSYSMLIEAIASGACINILELKMKKKSKLSREINAIKNKIKNKMTIQNEAERVAKFIQKIWF